MFLPPQNHEATVMVHKKRVIALGFFDGVHIGHSALLKRTLEIGAAKNLVPSVMTFDIHPHCLVTDMPVPLINSPDDRAGLIHRVFGIDDIIFLRFNRETANMPWGLFIDNLAHEFGAVHVVAGFDYSFGRGGKGSSALLEQKCAEQGIGCDIIPEVRLDGVVSSSSFVRELLASGDMERANRFLGHPHVLTDVVRYGFRLGRTLGTPTINMTFQPGVLVPAFGVYASKAFLDDGSGHVGVTNIGIRPTVDDSGQITAETHILDYRGNQYGHQVRLEFHAYLRPEIKFAGAAGLMAQIQKDCAAAQRLLVQT